MPEKSSNVDRKVATAGAVVSTRESTVSSDSGTMDRAPEKVGGGLPTLTEVEEDEQLLLGLRKRGHSQKAETDESAKGRNLLGLNLW